MSASFFSVLRCGAADRRSTPSGGLSPECKAGARSQPDRTSLAHLCHARPVGIEIAIAPSIGHAYRVAAPSLPASRTGIQPSECSSAVASSWISVSTSFWASLCCSAILFLLLPLVTCDGLDHLVELAFHFGLEVGFDFINIGKFGECPAAIASRDGSHQEPNTFPSWTSFLSRPHADNP